MNKILSFFILLFLTIPSFATWSIIYVDPKTNEIGIAGASCTPSVYGIGAVIPGKGAIMVQAMSNPFARSTGLKMIMADASPEEIIAALQNPDFDPEEQQYAVICMKYVDKPVTFTGADTHPEKGTITKSGISVQGNTLASNAVLEAVMNAAMKAREEGLSATEVLMLAMEAGASKGGDKRCVGTTASSAFITVYKSGDDRRRPSVNLVVMGSKNKVNAIIALREKFDNWKMNKKSS